MHLGIGQRFLRLHQLLLHLLRLREERRHVGLASGLHDSPLAYWSRLGCAHPQAAVWPFKPRRQTGYRDAVHVPACLRVGAAIAAGLLVAASTLASPASAAPANIAGMIVFLDPGHNGANDASISRQVPTGRGGTKDCQASGTSTDDGYPEHTFTWDTTLRIRQALTALGVRTAMSRGNDTGLGPCVDERAAMANALQPNAIVSASTPTAVRPPAAASTCSTRRRRSTRCRRARRCSSRRPCATSCRPSGFVPSTYIGSGGLNPRSDIAGLNLAQYPVDPRRDAAT